MFHTIITILTTAGVALHATLGCCAHHEHLCVSHESVPAVEVDEGEHHCSHGHQHQDTGDPASKDAADNCGHQHDGGQPHRCKEDNCGFNAVQQSDDVELMLTFSIWSQALGNAAQIDALKCSLSAPASDATPPDPLSLSGSACATTQVWRL